MKNLKLIFTAFAIVAGAMITFSNANTAEAQKGGPCICPQYYAPVCTYDGKEFANPCYAECRGYTEDEYEFCGPLVASASSATLAAPFPPYACPDVYDPVCTYDGKKFGNSCYAGLAGYSSDDYYKCGAAIY